MVVLLGQSKTAVRNVVLLHVFWCILVDRKSRSLEGNHLVLVLSGQLLMWLYDWSTMMLPASF